MIKRNYFYAMEIQNHGKFVCGIVCTTTWFPAPSVAFNKAIEDACEKYNCRREDCYIKEFNKL